MSVLRRRRTNRRRSSNPGPGLILTGALAVVLALFLLYVAFEAPKTIPLKPYYDVNAQFDSLGTISPEANVTVAGHLVGEVIDIRLLNGKPTLTLELNTSTPQLPVNTTARIRPRGLLGAEYVELTPGHAKRTIAGNGLIPDSQTSTADQLSDVLYAFDGPTRTHLGQTLSGLGEGFAGRGTQLNDLLATAPGTLRNLTKALGPTLSHPGQVSGLISGSELLSAAMDPVRGDIAQGFGRGSDALRPFAEQAASIRQLLDVAPTALSSIRSALGTTSTVLPHVTAFADDVTHFTALAPPALHALTAVLVKGRRPLRDATQLLKVTKPAVAPTLRLTSALKPELPYLDRLFSSLEPIVTTLGPYGCDFEGFAHNWRGFFGIGSKLQSGPMGPYTSLRVELVGPGLESPNTVLSGNTQSDDNSPCVTLPASVTR